MKPQPFSTLAVLPQVLALAAVTTILSAQDAGKIQQGEMAGYLLVPNEKVPESYNAGFSMYVAAWPLWDQYPVQLFQTGLFGTWMFARKEPPPPIKLYSDVEGGLGWWRDPELATETPKFIMGGVAPNFSEWANGPGACKGRDWAERKGKYGVAQLSPWLLWPPDGLNPKQGTCGELFGYGYLPLPLTPAKTITAAKGIPTGDQSWTLFLNTRNFKGPVAFFTPYFWSAGAVAKPRFSGMLLDSRPSYPNRALQMETQHVPSLRRVAARPWFSTQGAEAGVVCPLIFSGFFSERTLDRLLAPLRVAWRRRGPAISCGRAFPSVANGPRKVRAGWRWTRWPWAAARWMIVTSGCSTRWTSGPSPCLYSPRLKRRC